MKAFDKTMIGFALVLLAYWLLSKPTCNTGCKTVAEHLMTHGLDDVLAGLLA